MTGLHRYTCKRCGNASESADGHHHKEAVINSKHSKCGNCGAFAWDLKCPVDCEEGGLFVRLMWRLGWIRLESPEVKGILERQGTPVQWQYSESPEFSERVKIRGVS